MAVMKIQGLLSMSWCKMDHWKLSYMVIILLPMFYFIGFGSSKICYVVIENKINDNNYCKKNSPNV